MLAGWSQALLSQRHQLSFQLEEIMSPQSLDLPRSGFPRRDPPRVAFSLDRPADTSRTSCSFRRNTTIAASSSSSIVAAKREVEEVSGWSRGQSLKRFYEWSSSEEDSSCIGRVKRKRTGREAELVGGGGGGPESWMPRSLSEPSLVGDEKVYFVPSADILNNPLLGQFGTEVVNSGQRNGGGETNNRLHGNTNSGSGSGSGSGSSESRSSSPRPDGSSENDTGNGPRITRSFEGGNNYHYSEDQAFELVNLLTACVECISSGSHRMANYLARLGELASPTGSPIHRLAAYYTEALAIRVVRHWPHTFSVTLPRDVADHMGDDATALRILNHVSPIPRFIHFTINERLVRAFEGKDRVHVIDFDIKQGLQWPSLFQILASRPNPPSHVRITGIGESKQDLLETGARLAGIADSLNIPFAFEFHPVVDRLEDVRLWMLHVKEGECVAVNCVLQLHKTLYDETGGVLRDFLGLIRSTNPSVVLVAEEEAEHNDKMWEKRFVNSLKYYSAMFDAVDASLPLTNTARIKIEEMFARKIRNIVAVEGIPRVERHEMFDKWRTTLQESGFSNIGMGENEWIQSSLLLRMYSSENHSIEKKGEDNDSAALTLKWLDQPLFTVSAWAPVDAGGSSTSSQPG